MRLHRKRMALTIVEVLVAVAIILALAAVTHAVMTKARAAASNSTCLVRLRTLQNAVDVYRADWGNASSTMGSAVFLGLPHSPWKMLYTLSTDLDERSRLISCPVISSQTGIVTGIDWVPVPVNDFGIFRPITFSDATQKLGGDTPLFVDAYHNPVNLPFHNRGIRRLYLYTTLDSNVRSEYLVGIDVSPPPSVVSLFDWVLVKSQQNR